MEHRKKRFQDERKKRKNQNKWTESGLASSEGERLLCKIGFNRTLFDAAECQDFFTQKYVHHETSSMHAQLDF